jgi:hypothetical protein
MKRITAHLSVFFALAVAAPALAVNIQIDSYVPNSDGSTTIQLSIDTLNEVSFLDMTIVGGRPGAAMRQNPGGTTYAAISPSPWKPAVVFTSDASLAGAVDGTFYDQSTDTLIDDALWPGKVQVDLDPANDGSASMHVALASFTGGIGGPLPGGFVPFMQVTVEPGFCVFLSGQLQSDSDPNGEFHWSNYAPEPTSALLAVMGAFGLLATRRRRR